VFGIGGVGVAGDTVLTPTESPPVAIAGREGANHQGLPSATCAARPPHRSCPDAARAEATYDRALAAYARAVEPAVTWGLWASKAPNTSSFSRGGTSKWSSASASTAAT
jgi:hypothetical protein